jgi:hypothetical protein
VGGEAPVTPVSSPDSSSWTFPTNRAITGLTLIYSEADFLFCLLQLCFDQSAKGDLVFYNSRHDQSAKGD